jgi:hypothetical protein
LSNENLSIPDKNIILGQLAYSVGQLDAAEWHLNQYANLTHKRRFNGLKTALQTKTKPELILYCLTLLIENSVLADSLRKDYQNEIDQKRATNEI